jgi:sulfate adenylyltransferase subunit 2
MSATTRLSHLDALESEAVHIMREVASEFARPVFMFSGGKDSICLLRLAEKAFRPSDLPFPLLNIDTGHNFPELNAKLIVCTVEDSLASGVATQVPGEVSRNRLQIPTLLAAIEEFQFDCAIGGARRDEEKARAKERFFSFRDAFGILTQAILKSRIRAGSVDCWRIRALGPDADGLPGWTRPPRVKALT